MPKIELKPTRILSRYSVFHLSFWLLKWPFTEALNLRISEILDLSRNLVGPMKKKFERISRDQNLLTTEVNNAILSRQYFFPVHFSNFIKKNIQGSEKVGRSRPEKKCRKIRKTFRKKSRFS